MVLVPHTRTNPLTTSLFSALAQMLMQKFQGGRQAEAAAAGREFAAGEAQKQRDWRAEQADIGFKRQDEARVLAEQVAQQQAGEKQEQDVLKTQTAGMGWAPGEQALARSGMPYYSPGTRAAKEIGPQAAAAMPIPGISMLGMPTPQKFGGKMGQIAETQAGMPEEFRRSSIRGAALAGAKQENWLAREQIRQTNRLIMEDKKLSNRQRIAASKHFYNLTEKGYGAEQAYRTAMAKYETTPLGATGAFPAPPSPVEEPGAYLKRTKGGAMPGAPSRKPAAAAPSPPEPGGKQMTPEDTKDMYDELRKKKMTDEEIQAYFDQKGLIPG